MHRGYIKIWRKIEDNPLSHDPDFMAIWVWILLLANHSEKFWKMGYKNIPIQRGEFITSRPHLSEITGVNRSKLERILNYLESEQQIEQQKTTKYRLIKVLNYSKYQDLSNGVSNKRATSEQQVSITNKYKNDKNVNILPKYKKFFYGRYDGIPVYRFPDGLKVVQENGEVFTFGGNYEDIEKYDK